MLRRTALDQQFASDPSLNPADAPVNAAFDQQPPVDDAPQTAAPPAEPSDPAAELERIRADYQRTQSELERERSQRTQAEQRIAMQQRQVAENAAHQWAIDEQALHAALPQMDPDDAVKATAQFYQAQNRFLLQERQREQNGMHQERVAAFAAHVAKESGLSDQDVQTLLMTPGAFQEPNRIVDAAKTLKQSREASSAETKRLSQEIETLKRQMAGNGVRGAWTAGGQNGSAPSASVYDPKSDQYDADAHYAALMQHGRPAN